MLALFTGCSTDFSPQPCSLDSDCGSGLVCEKIEAEQVCVSPDTAKIVIGSSSATTGANQALGTQMKLGIQLAIDEANAKGGVRGRLIELKHLDDGYDPNSAEAAARMLMDVQSVPGMPKCPSSSLSIATNPPISPDAALERGPNATIAMVGNVGTPTAVKGAPVVVETHTLYFGAFTGAGTMLRNGIAGDCARYIFNVRASYAQEAYATMEYFKQKGAVNDWKKLISFDQMDSFGQAGYDGLNMAATALLGAAPTGVTIKRVRYVRNDNDTALAAATDAQNYITSLLTTDFPTGNVPVGIMMTDTYGAGDLFIRAMRTWQFDGQQASTGKATRLKLYFSNVSFVGPNDLAERLKANPIIPSLGVTHAKDVVVSQVVPNYQSDLAEVVISYNNLIAMKGVKPSFTSLEGYISTRIFIAGLLNVKGPVAYDKLVDAFETLPDLGLGLGANTNFKPCATDPMNTCGKAHQYSNTVWGTTLNDDGTFRNLYFWKEGQAIQFFD